MKKSLILIVLLALFASMLISQTVAEYAFSTSTNGSLEDMSTGTTSILGPGTYYDSGASTVANIGFTFNFAGTAYTQFSANSNGLMRLGGTVISGYSTSPVASTPILAALSGDNSIQSSGKIHYKLVGSVAPRKLVVEWQNLRVNYGSSDVGTFCTMQVWLYENTDRIDFVYGTMYNMSTSAQSRAAFISTGTTSGAIGSVATIPTTPSWVATGTSLVTSSFLASSNMANLHSSADGSRRVFSFLPPDPLAVPNKVISPNPAHNAINVALNPTLSWASGGGLPTHYNVYFDTVNPPLAMVSTQQTTLSYAVPSALNYNSVYYWKVVASNANGSAVNSDVWSFTTMADPTISSFPHTQNFDTATVPALPVGWSSINVNSDTVNWASYATSPYSAPNSASIGYNGSLALNDWLVSPPLNLLAGTTYALDFKYRGGATSYVEKLKVMLGTGSQVVDLSTQIFINENINFIDYTAAIATFTVPSNGTYYLGWHAYSIANQLRMYVDDIRIRIPAPIAPEPATLVFPLSGSTTLLNPMLKWTPSATGELATSYKVYLNTTGSFSEADLKYTGPALQYQTTGLVNGLTYSWKVVPSNANGATPNCPIWTFNTVRTDQLAEGFEATTFPPAGWANGTSGSWTRSTATPLFEGTAHAYKFTSTTLVYVLSTPMLTIENGNTVDFYTRASAISQVLQIVSSEDRVSWTPIAGLADITFAATGIWYPQSIDLSSLAGTNRYIGFQTPTHTSTGSIYIDHVVGPYVTPVTPGIPTLTAPANAAVNQSIAPILTWTAPSTGGIVSGYNVYIDTVAGTTLYASNVSSPYTPSPALAYDTTYYWTVRAYNGAGTGDPAVARSFTTMSDPTIYNLVDWLVDFGTSTSDTFPPLGWNRMGGQYPAASGTSTYWGRGNWLNGAAGNNDAKMNVFSTARYSWLITPPLAIPATAHELKFDLGLTDYANGDPIEDFNAQQDDKFIVAISASPAMSNPTILREWNNSGSAYVYNAIPNTGTSVILDLSGYSGTQYIAFYAESTLSGGDNDLHVDNVLVRETVVAPPDPVTLLAPVNGATNMPIGGFNLSWAPANTGGTPTQYEIYMGTTEDVEDHLWTVDGTSFDPTQAENDPITYNYNDTWYWMVNAINDFGASADDNTLVPFSFTIMGDPRILSLPYSQNFDGVATPALPAAWTGYKSNSGMTVTTSTSTPQSAPNNVYMYNSSYTSDQLRLISPEVVVPMNTAKISFYARSGSAGYTLKVGTVSALDGTGVFTELASYALTTTHTRYTLPLTGYAGTDRYICFEHGQGGTYRSIYIDNFQMEELVANDMSVVSLTGVPYGFQNTQVTHTVTVKNNGTSAQNSYTVYLKSVGTRAVLASQVFSTALLPNATNAVELTWTPTVLGSLEIYGEVSLTGDAVPVNNVSDNMTFNTYQQGVLFESFEGGVIPAGWTVRNADGGSYSWEAVTTNPRTGTYSGRVRWESTSLANDDWLITPPLQLSSTNTDEISFWLSRTSTSWTEEYEVRLSTTDNQIASFTELLEDGSLSTPANTYIQKTFNLDSYGNAVVYIAIRYNSLDAFYLHVDDFFGPPIFAPQNLAQPVVTITTTGTNVVLNWDLIPFANYYHVKTADSPEGPYTLHTTVTTNTYSMAASTKKFFQVIASSEAVRAITPMPLSREQQLLLDEADRAARGKK